jgi:hypothetical protein
VDELPTTRPSRDYSPLLPIPSVVNWLSWVVVIGSGIKTGATRDEDSQKHKRNRKPVEAKMQDVSDPNDPNSQEAEDHAEEQHTLSVCPGNVQLRATASAPEVFSKHPSGLRDRRFA